MNTRWYAPALAFAALIAACKGGDSSSGPKPGESGSGGGAASVGPVSVNGSGATFPNPLYQKWIQQYQSVEKNVKINYQSVGSGAGLKAIGDKTVDFGASDSPMSDDQLGKAQGKIVHIPTTLGAVVLTYNVKDAPEHLKLTPEIVAGIYLGEIKTWNDAKIMAENAGAKLPATPIGVVYRSDGSGTTGVFTDYLTKVSSTWKDKVGTNTSVKWPVGIGANKNDGVTNQVKQTPGSIGYIELAYARQNKLPTGAIKNKAGKFVEPALEGITAAAAGVAGKLPEDLRMSITDAEGDAAYPISAFSYILVYEDGADAAKSAAVANFLWWALHDGQKLGAALDFAPLPDEVVAKAEGKLKSLKAGGKPVLAGK